MNITIKGRQIFVAEIKSLPSLNNDLEDVSYNIQSLFTNIPVGDTINYITDQIYNKGPLRPICMKLIFKQLLRKLLTEVTFTLDSCFCK